jgi:hypothetical protein
MYIHALVLVAKLNELNSTVNADLWVRIHSMFMVMPL